MSTLITHNEARLPLVEDSRPALSVSGMPAHQWDRVLAEFADPYYEQTHVYRGAVWGEQRVCRLAIRRDGKIVALALVLIFKLPLLDRGLAHAKFGPVWRRRGEPDDPRNLELAIAAMVDEFVVRRRLSLSVTPPPDPRFAEVFRVALLGAGFRHAPSADPQRYFVDMSLSESEQRTSLGQSWRKNLKLALAHDFEVTAGTDARSIAAVDRIFTAMEKRKNYRNPSWPAFRDAMKSHLDGPVTPSVILVRHKGEPIAGAVIGHIGETVYYLYGATDDAAAELRAGYAMQWWIVNWLRDKNVRWYDLGGAAGEPGLRQFKKGLVGKRGVVASLPGEFTLCRDPLSRAAAAAIAAARSLRPRLKAVRAAPRRWAWKRPGTDMAGGG